MEQPTNSTFNSVALTAASSTVTLVVLKVMDQLDWSWRWTLSPLWVSLAFMFTHAFFSGLIRGLNGNNSEQ
jgi:hypothetical protein